MTEIKRKIRLFGALLLVLSASLSGCVDGEFDEPPMIVPEVDFEATTTIAELKASYTGLRLITEDTIIIRGVVVANDESGNLYKELVIQDESGAIELSLDRVSLYNEFKLGQRVYVICNGMYIGDFNGLIQLGYIFEGGIGRLPDVLIANHIYRDSLPGLVPAPELITMGDLSLSRISTLVRFENVRFAENGVEFAPQAVSATNRTLLDEAGRSIIVRTSRFSNFSSMLTPAGYGNVNGILTVFGTTWQLILRDSLDLDGFTGVVPPPPVGGDGSRENPFTVEQAIAQQNATPYVVGYVKGFIVGSVRTGVTSISSAADIHFSAPFTSATNVLLADTPDETDYMKCVVVNLPSGKPLRTQVNLVDNPQNLGRWLNVTGTMRTYFGVAGLRDCPGEVTDFELQDGGGGGGTAFFIEEFTSNLGGFSHFSVEGPQVWVWDHWDAGCAKMSGFSGGTPVPNEDWLISPPINLTGRTGSKLIFRHTANFVSDEWSLLQLMISSNYTGQGNPNESGTWTQLTIPTLPAGNNWVYVNSGDIDISAYDGQSTVFIAFRYRSTGTVAPNWQISKVEVW